MEELRRHLCRAVSTTSAEGDGCDTFYCRCFSDGICWSYEFDRNPSPICAAELVLIVLRYEEWRCARGLSQLDPIDEFYYTFIEYLKNK